MLYKLNKINKYMYSEIYNKLKNRFNSNNKIKHKEYMQVSYILIYKLILLNINTWKTWTKLKEDLVDILHLTDQFITITHSFILILKFSILERSLIIAKLMIAYLLALLLIVKMILSSYKIYKYPLLLIYKLWKINKETLLISNWFKIYAILSKFYI